MNEGMKKEIITALWKLFHLHGFELVRRKNRHLKKKICKKIGTSYKCVKDAENTGDSHGKFALIVASVASMIDQFNIPNIKLLISMGYNVDVATNFIKGSTCTNVKIKGLLKLLDELDVDCYQIDFDRKGTDIIAGLKSFKQLDDVVKGIATPVNITRHHLISHIDGRQYSFIHSHSPIGGVVGRVIGKKNGIKNIYTAHGFHFYDGAPKKNWLIYYPIEKGLSYITDVLITINKEDYRRAKVKFCAKKTVYIPGVGVDTEKFDSGLVEPEEKRKELGVNVDTILLLSVGELIPRKNHGAVIRALSKFPSSNFIYFIAGKGELEKELKILVRDLGMDNNVQFLGFRADVSELCQAADLFILPSHQEGLSLALMEAIACETPVICSDIRGNTDIVKGRECIFDGDSVDDIVRVLTPLLSGARLDIKEKLASNVKANKKVLTAYQLIKVENRMKNEFVALEG